MSIPSLFEQRDILIQLWVLFWIMVGNFGTWYAWKKTGSSNPNISIGGTFKKLVIGFFAWGLFLVAFTGIDRMGHLQVIMPALTWGISAEYIVGAFLQQKVEGYIKRGVKKEKDNDGGKSAEAEVEKKTDAEAETTDTGTDKKGETVSEVKKE